jgi:hypothetical protein
MLEIFHFFRLFLSIFSKIRTDNFVDQVQLGVKQDAVSAREVESFVIRSDYVTMVDNKPRQVLPRGKTCIRCFGVRVLY